MLCPCTSRTSCAKVGGPEGCSINLIEVPSIRFWQLSWITGRRRLIIRNEASSLPCIGVRLTEISATFSVLFISEPLTSPA